MLLPFLGVIFHFGTSATYSPDFYKTRIKNFLKQALAYAGTVVIKDNEYLNSPGNGDDFSYLRKVRIAVKHMKDLSGQGNLTPSPLSGIKIVLLDKTNGDAHRLIDDDGEYVQTACSVSGRKPRITIFMTKRLFQDLYARDLAKRVLIPHINQARDRKSSNTYRDDFQGHIIREIHLRLVDKLIYGVVSENKIIFLAARYSKKQARKIRSYIDLMKFMMKENGLSSEESRCFFRIGSFFVAVELIIWPIRLLTLPLAALASFTGFYGLPAYC